MKNFIKIVGIVAMAAIIGFAFVACEGPMGPQGEQGIQGEQGEKGDAGAKGDQGEKGDAGAKGDQGEKGDNGTAGTYYTVTFDANGGTGTLPGKQKVEAGYAIILPPAEGLYKDFHPFIGWNSKVDGTGTAYAVGISYTPAAADDTLYAAYNNEVAHIPAESGLRGTLWYSGITTLYIKISDDGTALLGGTNKNSLTFSERFLTYTNTNGEHTFTTDSSSYLWTANATLTELKVNTITYTPVSE